MLGASLFGDVVHAHLGDGLTWEAVAGALHGAPTGGHLQAERIEPSLEDIFIQRVREAAGHD